MQRTDDLQESTRLLVRRVAARYSHARSRRPIEGMPVQRMSA